MLFQYIRHLKSERTFRFFFKRELYFTERLGKSERAVWLENHNHNLPELMCK